MPLSYILCLPASLILHRTPSSLLPHLFISSNSFLNPLYPLSLTPSSFHSFLKSLQRPVHHSLNHRPLSAPILPPIPSCYLPLGLLRFKYHLPGFNFSACVMSVRHFISLQPKPLCREPARVQPNSFPSSYTVCVCLMGNISTFVAEIFSPEFSALVSTCSVFDCTARACNQ